MKTFQFEKFTNQESKTPKRKNFNQKSELFAAAGEWSVVVVYKENDYDYRQRYLPTGQWTDLNDLPSRLVKLSADRKKIPLEGPAFQIVRVTRD